MFSFNRLKVPFEVMHPRRFIRSTERKPLVNNRIDYRQMTDVKEAKAGPLRSRKESRSVLAGPLVRTDGGGTLFDNICKVGAQTAVNGVDKDRSASL